MTRQVCESCRRPDCDYTDCCYHHGVEPALPEHVAVCIECGHRYTVEELLRLDGEHRGVTLDDWNKIDVCPLCTSSALTNIGSQP